MLLTVAFEGDREVFTQAVLADLVKLIEAGAATQAAVNVRVEGQELEVLKETINEHDVRAVVALWDPESPAAAPELPLPVGSRLLGGYLVNEVVQNHMVDYLTDTTPRWDGIGELHYRTVDDIFTGTFDSEEGQRLIMEDVERFVAADQYANLPTNEFVVWRS